MYCLVVYDVNVEKVSSVCKLLRQYLNWIQNSVFEGEIGDADYLEMKNRLKELADTGSVLIFKFRDKYSFEKEVIGTEKSPVSNIL